MKNIGLYNYEVYALDFIEGKLSGDDLLVFELFLEKNPEIRDEIAIISAEQFDLENDIEFIDKSYLKKEAMLSDEINSDNYQSYFIAYLEGDLSEKTKLAIIKYIGQFPEKKKEFELISNLRFVPDHSLRFLNKRQVKKTTPLTFLYQGLRIAASVIIILGMAWFFYQLNTRKVQYSKRRSFVIDNQVNENKPVFPGNKGVKDKSQIIDSKIITPDLIKKRNSMAVNTRLPRFENNDTNRIKLKNPVSIAFKPAVFIPKTKGELHVVYQKSNEWGVNDETIFKLKFPKLLKKGKIVNIEHESNILARVNYNQKKEKRKKTYVSIGPLKVYKTKNGNETSNKF